MIIRKIRDEEAKRAGEVFNISFEFQTESKETAEEMAERLRTHPKGRGEVYFREKWAAFEDDDTTMMGFIAVTPYNVAFDGHTCRMGGMGGVSTLPQHRRRGCVRGCFNSALRGMYDEGYVFSYLYPFSTAYYNKFGYELCGEAAHYQIDLRSIRRFPEAEGQAFLIEKGGHLEEIRQVYDGFRAGYNMMAAREEMDWLWVKEADPARDGVYTYLWRNAAGEPKGVMSFRKERVGDPKEFHFNMQCNTFFFSDLEGFKGLLNHSLAFAAYYEKLIFRLPTDIHIAACIPEWALYPYQRNIWFNGMVRVINVKKALELARYQGDGSYVVRVRDGQLAENDGTFEVVFREGRAASVEKTEKEPDAELDIRDFSRFLVGTHAPEELRWAESARFFCDLEKTGKVFYKKPNFIDEHF